MLPIQNQGLDLRDLVVEQVPISSLKPYPTNPRTHTRKQIRQIAESIRTFGWTNPVLVDADGRIIAGHGRVEAAKLLGTPHVPVLRIEDLTEAQIKAYVIADNKLAELADWDAEILANELQLLSDHRGVGIGVNQELRKAGYRHLYAASKDGTSNDSKIDRFGRALIPMYDGVVKYPLSGTFIDDVLYALATFPELKEFDLIDSITQLIAFLPTTLMFARQNHRPTNL